MRPNYKGIDKDIQSFLTPRVCIEGFGMIFKGEAIARNIYVYIDMFTGALPKLEISHKRTTISASNLKVEQGLIWGKESIAGETSGTRILQQHFSRSGYLRPNFVRAPNSDSEVVVSFGRWLVLVYCELHSLRWTSVYPALDAANKVARPC